MQRGVPVCIDARRLRFYFGTRLYTSIFSDYPETAKARYLKINPNNNSCADYRLDCSVLSVPDYFCVVCARGSFVTLHRKKQATITWVPRKRTYHITCLSKNGMVVNGKYKAKGGVGEIHFVLCMSIEQKTRTGGIWSCWEDARDACVIPAVGFCIYRRNMLDRKSDETIFVQKGTF